MESKPKPCKGTSKAIGHGCGTPQKYRKYGLGVYCCYPSWLLDTPEGKETLSNNSLKNKKALIKEIKSKDRAAKSELNTKGAMNLADTYFSRYIRLKYSSDGVCTCYTCGADKDIKDTDNGHYKKRQYKTTRYHENNCRPQCKTCNGDIKHNGREVEFRIGLVNELGLDKIEALEALSRESIKANTIFFREKADYYRNKLNDLQKLRGVKYW